MGIVKLEHDVIWRMGRLEAIFFQRLPRPNVEVPTRFQSEQVAVVTVGMQEHIGQSLKARRDAQRALGVPGTKIADAGFYHLLLQFLSAMIHHDGHFLIVL